MTCRPKPRNLPWYNTAARFINQFLVGTMLCRAHQDVVTGQKFSMEERVLKCIKN